MSDIRRDADGHGRQRALERALGDAVTRDRLAALPSLCDRLVAQPEVRSTEAELALRGLPRGQVMHLAVGLRSVARVVASLPADFAGWAP